MKQIATLELSFMMPLPGLGMGEKGHSLNIDSEGKEEESKKNHRTSVNEDLFSWKGTSAVLHARLKLEASQSLHLLED